MLTNFRLVESNDIEFPVIKRPQSAFPDLGRMEYAASFFGQFAHNFLKLEMQSTSSAPLAIPLPQAQSYTGGIFRPADGSEPSESPTTRSQASAHPHSWEP